MQFYAFFWMAGHNFDKLCGFINSLLAIFEVAAISTLKINYFLPFTETGFAL